MTPMVNGVQVSVGIYKGIMGNIDSPLRCESTKASFPTSVAAKLPYEASKLARLCYA